MRLGTLCPLHRLDLAHAYAAQGFEFLELCAPHDVTSIPPASEFPPIPLIWQCPPDLPAEHPNTHIQAAVQHTWHDHLEAAKGLGTVLMVVQFRRPLVLENKAALIEQYIRLLQPLTENARGAGIQLVLRNSPDNRDQLQMLREIVRSVAGLALGLDIAYTHHQVVKSLFKEYLYDSDLAPRLAHIYASESNGQDSTLRLPLEALGNFEWSRMVSLLKERYNASITLDIGDAALEYLESSRAKWLAWWS